MIWIAGEARSELEPDVRTIFNLGYQIILFPTNFLIGSVQHSMAAFQEVQRTGRSIMPNSDPAKVEIEAVVGLPDQYAMERETTERNAPR
jgi:hypothetical protein